MDNGAESDVKILTPLERTNIPTCPKSGARTKKGPHSAQKPPEGAKSRNAGNISNQLIRIIYCY